jgi:uncharacterized membrane protein
MKGWVLNLPRRSFLVLMLAGSALITSASLQYFDPEQLPLFVIEKLPHVRFESLWLASLRTHVVSAALSLPLCLVLMTRTLQRRPAWHRWLGRATGLVVLGGLVPSGVVLALEAKGGAAGSAGFLLSAAIVAGAMALGVAAARRRDFATHRRAMRHVVAQMSVAVSSRALIIAFDVAGFDPNLAYLAALWGPVLASALAAELLSPDSALRSLFAQRTRVSTLRLSKGIRREISPLALPVRVRSVPVVSRLGR